MSRRSSAPPPRVRRASGRSGRAARGRAALRRSAPRPWQRLLDQRRRRSPPVSAWLDDAAQERRRVGLDLVAELARGWRGCRACRPAGCRSARGCSAPAGRRRGSRRGRARCLTSTLETRLRPVMLRPRTSRFSFTNADTWPSAIAEVAQRGGAAPRARRPAWSETLASDWLKPRTVWSLLGQRADEPLAAPRRSRTAPPCCRRGWR